jgi:transposase-like protein
VWKRSEDGVTFRSTKTAGESGQEGDAVMEEKSTRERFGSRTIWESLEGMARERIQEFLQVLLEEEVTALVGRRKSERRETSEGPAVYRNGHGKPRKLALMAGTIEVRRPRLRGLEERFESAIVPLFRRRTQEVGELLPQLYLHGLAQGDFELALRGLLGDGAPLSASSIERLRGKWVTEFEAWSRRSLRGLEPVYLWADGIYVKAGLEKDKAALLVIVAGLRDGRKVVLAVESGYRESAEAWGQILRGLRARGMGVPRLVIADGHLGIWAALSQALPEVAEQRCWNHKIVNVLDTLPQKLQGEARELLCRIPYAPTQREAEKLRDEFRSRYGRHQAKAVETLERDWERLVAFYAFPQAHWKHLRTTNPVESPFAAVRLRTAAGKRYRKVANATALIWRVLLVAERKFRRFDHPDLLAEVADGVAYKDGVRVVLRVQPTTAEAAVA